MFKTTLLAGALALGLPMAAFASGIMVDDAYARASTPTSVSGAAFMRVTNHTGADDRLIAASSSVAERTELHTHQEDANGVMKMIHVEEGFDLPAGETLTLERGGKHVMFLGLTEPLEQGDMVTVTLTFETAGDVVVEVPVDLERGAGHGHGGHGDHGHGDHAGHDHSDEKKHDH